MAPGERKWPSLNSVVWAKIKVFHFWPGSLVIRGPCKDEKNNDNDQGYPWWPAVVLPSEEGEWTTSSGGKFRCVFLQDNQSFK